ncbi:MAG TPA: T9SS type A sorting domain-containing protein, partial [Bacteroidia bacterium]|nr:T9SS type A sorting domain-containing protein [Bacteroidia bacterium]
FGGGLYIQGDNTTLVTLKACRISNNNCNDGGGVLSTGNLVMYDCIVENNKTDNTSGGSGYGGGICIAAGKFWISRSIIQNNAATTSSTKGGGIYVSYNSGYITTECSSCSASSSITAQIDSCSFTGNTSNGGNDVYIGSGTVNLSDNTFGSGATQTGVGGGTVNMNYCGSPSTSGTITFTGGTGHSSARYTGPAAAYLPVSTGIPSFSGSCPTTPSLLPVALLAWNGTCVPDGNLLRWETASETNNRLFRIERSADGENFEMLSTKPGAGNSSLWKAYAITDTDAPAGLSYYRLSQEDFNGNIHTFFSIPVRNSCTLTGVALSIYPNPATSELTLGFDLQQSSSLTCEICNALGQHLFSCTSPVFSAGRQNLQISLSTIPPGAYLLKTTLNGQVVIRRFMHL